MVDLISSASNKLVISVVPTAIEDNIKALCDIDLSPGIVSDPVNFCILVLFIFQCFVRVILHNKNLKINSIQVYKICQKLNGV